MALDSSVYDDRPSFPFRRSPGPHRHPVVVLGAGPVGLALAAGLARHGQPCVVIEPRGEVAFGSRAICISRRSLEILESFRLDAPLLAEGLPWSRGHSYWRGHHVLSFEMPLDADQRHPPMLNLQQCFLEARLIEAMPAEVDLRWHSRMVALAAGDDGVRMRIATPAGEYELRADYVVACDGARSPTRAALGLELQGTSYEGRYLIADIRHPATAPTERRAWFDPPSNPGSTVLMHKQPRGIWRIDYQLRDEEDAEEAQQESAVRARIDAHLAGLGWSPAYDLVLISLYRAHCLTLDRYRHGRVLLAGDAAHLVPIFGVRGLNSGLDDAGNLAWKLAAVARGEAPDGLLDSYSEERVFAARENIRQSRKSTLFMTPPSRGHALMRDAALSLAVGEAFARALVNPRQSTAIAFPASPLQSPQQGVWNAGPAPGETLPSVPLGRDHIRPGSTPLVILATGDAAAQSALAPHAPLRVTPDDTRAVALLGLDAPGAGYLVRPDGHVAWRWRRFDATGFATALRRMQGH